MTLKLFLAFVLSIILVTSFGYVHAYEISQEKTWDVPVKFHAIYTESGLEISFLEVGQQAYIAFPLRQNQDDGPEIESIMAGYQVVDDKSFPRYNDESV